MDIVKMKNDILWLRNLLDVNHTRVMQVSQLSQSFLQRFHLVGFHKSEVLECRAAAPVQKCGAFRPKVDKSTPACDQPEIQLVPQTL